MPNIKELKELARYSKHIETRIQDVSCQVCNARVTQTIITYEDLQIRECKGHRLYYDSYGKYLWAVEHKDGNVDWRTKFDLARTEGVTPQMRAWLVARRKGGRGKKGGSGWFDPGEKK